MIALFAVLLAFQAAEEKRPCEIRIYVLDKDQKPASLQGVTALLVTEDRAGLEKLVPLRMVTAEANSDRAPNCTLTSRRVDGTGLTVALCAVGRPQPPDAPEDETMVEVAFVAPYFKGRIPGDHLCGPGCRTSIRLAMAGNFHSTRSFPCPAGWTSGAPTCCLPHQLVAECAEARRHLAVGEQKAATAGLGRIDLILLRVTAEELRRDAQLLSAWAQSALDDQEPRRAKAAVEELRSLVKSRMEPCGVEGGSP